MKNVQRIDLGLTGYDELFMNDAERKENKLPRIYDVPISEIDDFPDHPFKVKVDEDMLIGSGYTLEEVDTAIRYVVPASQSAAVEWNSVTNKSFSNILKKFNVTVTKSDCETGTAQGDASLAGATYGIYKGDQLVDT